MSQGEKMKIVWQTIRQKTIQTTICPICGKKLTTYPHLKTNRRTFCSRKCYAKAVKQRTVRVPSQYDNGKDIKCLICGKSFYVSKSLVGVRKFCGRKCYEEHWVKQRAKSFTKDTLPERIFEAGLKSLGIKYEKQVRVGRTVMDFFILPKTAIYVDGDYWHTKDKKVLLKDERINKMLIDKGYEVLRFWECEIQDKRFFPKLIQMVIK